MFVSKTFMLSMISFVELLWQLVVLLLVAHFMNIVFLESMTLHWLFQLIRRAGHTLFFFSFLCVDQTSIGSFLVRSNLHRHRIGRSLLIIPHAWEVLF
jgi:uncharacterized PurR-regulated membrane protein YhhQ (DUF165 family)